MKKWKRGLSAALSLVLGAGLLAGCGSKGAEDPGVTATAAPEGGDTAETAYVYVSSFLPVTGFAGDASLSEAVWTGDSFVVSSHEMIADHTPEGVIPEYEGEYWDYGPVLYRLGLDGKAEKLPWQPASAAPDSGEAQETEAEEEPAQDAGNTAPQESSGSSIAAVCPVPGGGLLTLERAYRSWYDGPADRTVEDEDYWDYWQYEERYMVQTLDAAGNFVSAFSLDEIGGEYGAYFYPRSFVADGEGNLYLTGNDRTVCVLSPAGELLRTLETEGWAEKLLTLADGSVACVYYGTQGLSMAVIDPKTGTLGTAVSLRADGDSLSAGGGDYDLYYTNGINFFGYSLETGEAVQLLNWLDCDVNYPDSNNSAAAVLEDGRVAIASTEWGMNDEHPVNHLVVLEKKPWDSVPHKESLTLATMGLDSDARAAVLNFNRTNGRYRVEVRDYAEYNNYYSDDEADHTAGLTKLKTEIGAGNIPDLLDLDALPMERMAAKGLLEDLYPYLDADPELDRSDMIETVLEALEVDGGLYTTCSSFNIYTVVGASRVVGDTPGWTYGDFYAALASMPEGCTAFDRYVTRDGVLQYCLALDLDQFVNWSTGACNFDSEAFCDLLEFVKSFPSDFDWASYDYSDDDSSPSRIAAGKQMLVMTGIGDFQEQQMFRAMFGGDMTYIGFPTSSGTGSMIMAGSGAYAMSAKCAHKDAAWEFLRQFFRGGSSRYSYGLSLNRDAFEAQLAEAMTPEYEKDENGNFVLDENGQRIEVSHSGWSWGPLSIQIYAMTEAEAAQLRELIATTSKLYKVDDSIFDIINEQLPAFFDGEKTAEETARLIQSKAMLYVNEQR